MSLTIMDKLLTAVQQLTADKKELLDLPVEVNCLTPVEAIGFPGDRDYPLLRGKEILLQARFRKSPGQAFTGSPASYQGRLGDVIELDLEKPENRAIFIASLNALLRDQGLIKKTVHCHNGDPEECGRQIAIYLKQEHNPKKVGIAGYQPALISACIDFFGPDRVKVTDLGADNLGKIFRDVEIWDGMTQTDKLIAECDILLVTGSVFANNTAEPFYRAAENGKPLYFFGTTVTGIAHLLGLAHLCPMGT